MSVGLAQFRTHELEVVRSRFEPGLRVLEIGGGNGLQASLLQAHGLQVRSLDIAPAQADRSLFPVERYDGRSIPCPDAGFDLVFSSNVLEHVRDLDTLLSETIRVLRPGGLAIHVLPTPTWRLWTSLAHYAYLVLRVCRPGRPVSGGHVPSLGEKLRRSGWGATAARVLAAGPHGEYPSAVSELWYFRRRRWMAVFRAHGLAQVDCAPAGIFYTGYSIAPWLSMAARKRLARVLGSSTCIHVLRKP